MDPERERDRRLRERAVLLVLVGASLLMLLAIIAFDRGLEATPYGAVDSAGRTMGFNDPFSHEHYGIILGNMRLGQLTVAEAFLVAAQVVMAGLLLRCWREQWIVAYACLQGFLFPWAWLGLLVGPVYLWGVIRETADREAFVDIPFVQLMAGAAWLVVAGLIAWRMWAVRRRERTNPA